jgi:hypothetical protein
MANDQKSAPAGHGIRRGGKAAMVSAAFMVR